MGTDNNVITLIHGDCLIEMAKIPDKSIDCIISDPPFGVLNSYNPKAKWDSIIPFDKLWEQYERIIKDNGAIILFGCGMFTSKLMASNEKLWRYNLIWDKVNRSTGFLNANRMPLRIHEDICVFYKKLPTYNPQYTIGHENHHRGGNSTVRNRHYGKFHPTKNVFTNKKYPTSIVKIEKEHRNNEFYHATQKPVALIEWLIRTYSNKGELILDNTAGSMTTAIACINTDRRCICIEKDNAIFEIGRKRVEDYQAQLKLFSYED